MTTLKTDGSIQPVLILGAGINGAAIARELALQGVPVTVVERADIAFGATAYSSRLIHGGLRYLEYGEFSLVRESLAERGRLLQLAPQFVRPLELFIPVTQRSGGFRASAARFLQLERWAKPKSRGLWMVSLGLWMYDRYAHDPHLPKHRTHRVPAKDVPRVDPARYRWACSYYDAQVRFVERFVMALFEDARLAAQETGVPFELLTRHEATLVGSTVEIRPVSSLNATACFSSSAALLEKQAVPRESSAQTFEPAAIINATGAWVDETLRRLQVPNKQLMGGTKGTHLITSHPGVRDALCHGAVYAEGPDGRPVFLLPFGRQTLIGTTDIPYSGDPADAVASQKEIDYLLATTNSVLADTKLTEADIDLHYSGVRPLPHVDAATPGAVTRRHWLEPNSACPVPLYSVIGGKLTTCRSLAEESTDTILARLGLTRRASTRDRLLPGAENYPADEQAIDTECRRLAESHGLGTSQIHAIWTLVGTRARAITAELARHPAERGSLPGTDLPESFVRWVIRHEGPRSVDDLVERRLMLLYDPRLSRTTLDELARLLVEENVIAAADAERQVTATVERLRTHFGKKLSTD